MQDTIRTSSGAVYSPFALTFLIFVSGALAVAYEVSWARMLGVAAGHGVTVSAVVVATFMAGLGFGRWLSEHSSMRSRDPLTVYAVAEAAIAVFALGFSRLIQLADPLVTSAYRSGAGSTSLGLHLAWAALLLLVPTTLMGLTLPTLARVVADRTSSKIATLYAAHSFGGAFGALTAVFVMLPRCGYESSMRYLTVIGLALFIVTRVLSTMWAERSRGVSRVAAREAEVDGPTPRLALVVALVCGFAGLALQGAWTRTLVLFLGSGVHAVTLILALFVTGLAFGGAVARLLLAKLDETRVSRVTAVLIALTAVAAGASGPILARVPAWMATIPGNELSELGCTSGVQLRVIAAVVLPASLLLGVVWPLAVRLSGGRTGHVSAANTLGAVVGALAMPLVLLPTMGFAASLAIVAVLLATTAATLWSAQMRFLRVVFVGSAGLVLVTLVPPFDAAMLNSGPLVAGDGLLHRARDAGSTLATALTKGRILFHQEGAAATVAVREDAGNARTLLINGTPDASSQGNRSTPRLLAHLPLVLAPDAADVLVLGMGTGVTTASVLTHPVKRVTVAEVSPEVVAASRYFHASARGPLADERTQVVIADARTHVERSAERYDVITSQPTNPTVSGDGSLFTREFFAACRSRLKWGGVMAQWVKVSGLAENDFLSVVHTFRTVFPRAMLWRAVDGADYLLIGRTTKGPIVVSEMRRALSLVAVQEDLEPMRVADELDLLGRFICGPKGLATLCTNARLQTDDRLDLEFSRPAKLHETASDHLRRHLAESAEPLLDYLAVDSSPAFIAALSVRKARDNALRMLGPSGRRFVPSSSVRSTSSVVNCACAAD